MGGKVCLRCKGKTLLKQTLAEVERRRPKEKKSVKDLDFISRILTLKLEKATKFCDVSTNYLTGST